MNEDEEYTRLAVLSDVHGVLPALEAVLAEPEVAAAERIVLTGDITAGPQPAEVLDLLREQGDRVLWIGGNADRELVEYRRGERAEIPDPIGQDRRHYGVLPQPTEEQVSGMGQAVNSPDQRSSRRPPTVCSISFVPSSPRTCRGNRCSSARSSRATTACASISVHLSGTVPMVWTC